MSVICSGLKEKLSELGLKKGDDVYISSDVLFYLYSVAREYGTSKKYAEKALNELTNTFQEVVGAEGTILFPVFSWDFCRGKGFDYYKTQGEVGTFSNWILNNRKDFKRTQHPLYSFMVWGSKKDFFCNMNNQDAWGVASPFYYLMKNGGKQLEFNCEAFKGLTFIHCIEQWVKVPYRHHKYFFGKYMDADGNMEIRSYSLYVRDLDVDEYNITTNKFLVDNGAAKEIVWKGNNLTLVDIAKCYDVAKNDIIDNNGANTLGFKNYEFDFNCKQTLPYEVGNIPEDCE